MSMFFFICNCFIAVPLQLLNIDLHMIVILTYYYHLNFINAYGCYEDDMNEFVYS